MQPSRSIFVFAGLALVASASGCGAEDGTVDGEQSAGDPTTTIASRNDALTWRRHWWRWALPNRPTAGTGGATSSAPPSTGGSTSSAPVGAGGSTPSAPTATPPSTEAAIA